MFLKIKSLQMHLLMGGDNANVLMKPLRHCLHKFVESLKVNVYFRKNIRFWEKYCFYNYILFQGISFTFRKMLHICKIIIHHENVKVIRA